MSVTSVETSINEANFLASVIEGTPSRVELAFEGTTANTIDYNMSISSGTVPTGMVLVADNNTGATRHYLEGTPETAGLFEFDVDVDYTGTASGGTETFAGKIYVDATSKDLPEILVGQVGVQPGFTIPFVTDFGTELLKFEMLDDLPAGLVYSAPDRIVGLPTTEGKTAVDVRLHMVDTAGTTTTRDEAIQFIIQPAATAAITVEVDPDTEEETETIDMSTIASPIADDYALELDFDLLTRELSIPGSTDADTTTTDTEMMMLSRGEYLQVAIGAMKRGILQDLAVGAMYVTFKMFEPERVVLLSLGDLTETGTGNGDRRYLSTIYVDPSKFNNLLARGTGTDETKITGRLQVELAESLGATEKTIDPDEETLGTYDQDDTETDTLALVLTDFWESEWDTATVDLTLALVVPDDTGLNCSFTRRVVISKPSDFAIDSVTGDTTATGASTVADDWDSALEMTSLAATATGLDIGSEVTSTEQYASHTLTFPPTNWTLEDVGGGVYELTEEPVGQLPEQWSFRDSGDTEIFEWSPASTPRTAAQIKGVLDTGLGETVTVVLDDTNIIVTLASDSAVAKVVDIYNGADTEYARTSTPGGPSYTGATVTASAVGVSNTGGLSRVVSHGARVSIHRDHE